MATSGQVIFNMSAGDIVRSAFRKLGVNPAEQALQAFELQDGITALNLLITKIQAKNPHLWATTEGVVFLNLDQSVYALGPAGDNATLSTDFLADEINLAASSGATSLTLKTTVGMLANDYIGIQINNNLRQWARIVSVTSATTLTIDTPLVDDVAVGNSVFTYTKKLNRPLRVLDSRRKTFGQPDEIALTQFSRQQYFDQVNKDQNGIPISWYYSPQLDNGLLYIWQPTSTVNQYLRFTFYTPLEIIVNAANTLYFPSEWQLGFIWALSDLLAPDYNIPAEKKAEIKEEAKLFMQEVEEFDEEMTSINVMPDYTRY